MHLGSQLILSFGSQIFDKSSASSICVIPLLGIHRIEGFNVLPLKTSGSIVIDIPLKEYFLLDVLGSILLYGFPKRPASLVTFETTALALRQPASGSSYITFSIRKNISVYDPMSFYPLSLLSFFFAWSEIRYSSWALPPSGFSPYIRKGFT